MMTSRGLALAAGVVGALARVAGAASGTWATGGPYGGSVLSMAADPADALRVYAGGAAGSVARSTDGGASWTVLDHALGHRAVSALAVAPKSGHVYAGTSGPLFRSTDAGATWTELDFPGAGISVVTIDPTTPARVYVGTLGGAFRSTDAGASWATMKDLPATWVRDVAIGVSDPLVLHAAVSFGFGHVYRSTDGGTSWTHCDLPSYRFVSAAVDPVTSTTAYAGTDDQVPLYKTTDGGTTWLPASAGLPPAAYVEQIAIDASAPSLLWVVTIALPSGVGGLYRSTDGGGSWQAAISGLTDPAASVLLTPVGAYASTWAGRGVYRLGRGDIWEPSSSGLTMASMTALAPDPLAPGAAYAAETIGGGLRSYVYRTTNGGGTWAQTSVIAQFVSSLAASPVAPSLVYAATGAGLARSTDGGVNWTHTTVGPNGTVKVLALHPSSAASLYLAVKGGGVLRSTNGGASWQDASAGLPDLDATVLEIDAASPDTLYVRVGAGLQKTTNGGGSWSPSGAGLPADVTSLAVDPAAPSVLYAGLGSAGVRRSTDGGASWTATALATGRVGDVAVEPGTPSVLYAVHDVLGVVRSADGGATFTPVNHGLEPSPHDGPIAVDAGTGTVYLGGDARSVWQATGLVPVALAGFAVE